MHSCHLLLALVVSNLGTVLCLGKCKVPGECHGLSLHVLETSDERSCLAKCQLMKGECRWYSFDHESGYCDLLRDCPTLDGNCTTCSSGEVSCSQTVTCMERGECQGQVIQHKNSVPDGESCLKACYVNDECKWFAFNQPSGFCSLYSSCSPSGDIYSGHSVLGERACYKMIAGPTKILIQSGDQVKWIHAPSTPTSFQDDLKTHCSQPPELPFPVEGTVGYLVEGRAVFCGGLKEGGNSTSSHCFLLNSSNNVWVEIPPMPEARANARITNVFHGNFWLTGGSSVTDGLSSQTFMYLDKGRMWEDDPDLPHLPSPRQGHCVVRINASATFLAGGQSEDFETLTDAYFIDWDSLRWTRVQDMPLAQAYMACALREHANGTKSIVMAGGSYTESHVQSFNLEIQSWVQGSLTMGSNNVVNATFVRDGKDLVLVNPSYGNVLRLNGSEFQVVPGMDTGGIVGDATVMAIGDQALYGCK